MDQKPKLVKKLMTDFAEDTGLIGKKQDIRRYLWTDAFAVCNFLHLYSVKNENSYLDLAEKLVYQVHHTLGQHRKDDDRSGWISGLSESEGEKHPTIGGLRIGKELNERKPGEPFNERLEWNRDGQYFHYLTKWMHALNRIADVTENQDYLQWAIELAETAFNKFIYTPSTGGEKRMYWKMSIDLSYPLVPSMGHHDPIDGYVTFLELQASSEGKPGVLIHEIEEMKEICKGKDWVTSDSLGLGGLLWDIHRLTQLVIKEKYEKINLMEQLLRDSRTGLAVYLSNNELKRSASFRLAFRELGLAIGMQGIQKTMTLITEHPGEFDKNHRIHEWIDFIIKYADLVNQINGFWQIQDHRETETWLEHEDINQVMLATSLEPEAFLKI